MLGIDRRVARYTFTAAVVLFLLYLVYIVRSTLFVFIVALLFAYLLTPLVNALDRLLPGQGTRTAALALSYIIFLGFLVTIGVLIGNTVVKQAKDLNKSLPSLIQSWKAPTPGTPGEVASIKQQLADKVLGELSKRSGDVLSMLPVASEKFLTIASNLIYVVIIPILALFFLKDGNAIREHILTLVKDAPRRDLLDDVMADINLLLAHYMRALVVLASCAFSAYAIFFSVTRIPYGILLAVLGALLEFIPMVGPLAAAVTIIVVTAISGGPVVAIVIFLGVYRVIQDYVLSPHLMGRGIELHPLLVLFGVFAGAEIAGVAGTFLSVPVLALVRVLYVRIRRSRLGAPAPAPVRQYE